MGFGPFTKRSYMGLDIGHYSIKIVQIERTQAGWRITRTASAPTPDDAVKECVVIDPEVLGVAIKDLIKSSGISASSAFVAVAGGPVVVRNVRIPKMPEVTLRKSIRFEASRYVPSSIEDSYIEFEILGEHEDGTMDVIIVAAPRDMVDSRLKACELAGLEVEAVDVEPFAAYRSLVEAANDNDYFNSPIVLVDIGSTMTNMSVVEAGNFSMTRSISSGGQTMTDALKSYFKLSSGDAESGKSQLNVIELLDEQPKENPPLRIIQHHIDDLVREIRRSLNYYQSQQNETSGNKNISGLVICGGGAKMQGLTEYIAEKLGVKAISAGVFDNPRFSYGGSDEPGRGLDLAVASGLAMRAFSKAA